MKVCVKSEFPNVSLLVDDFLFFLFLAWGGFVSVLSVLSGQLSLSEGGSFDQSSLCR